MKIATFTPQAQVSKYTLLTKLDTNQIEQALFDHGLDHEQVWMALDILDTAVINATLGHLIDAAIQAVEAEHNGSY